MTITLKQINTYQEFEPYDVDVDNRPLYDIQDNFNELVGILQDFGGYTEIQADPSQEPVGGFNTFTCACILTNGLLAPIDISKSAIEIDYTKYPIILILGQKDTTTNAYPCLAFSAGIALSSKFMSFVPGSEGRLLRVGPGGILIDQLYYDLAYASRGYQALYVGKILTTTSIVFGGNQVSVLGNNYYLAKNRDDSTSGLISIQRDNSLSNIVFKSTNVNTSGTPYIYSEYVNNATSSNSVYTSPAPVYFSTNELPFDQVTGLFTSQVLESALNEVHFSTPSINTFTNVSQTYLTSGVNVRSLFDFASTSILHSPTYSNAVSELAQNISTKLIFTDRPKLINTDPDIPIGLSFNSPIKSVGDNILPLTNIPANLIPTADTTGIVISDYFNTFGGYIGGVKDDSTLTSTRMLSTTELTMQQAANGGIGYTTNGINDYSNSFTLVVSAKSSTTIPANLVLIANGYVNLSSGNGVLVNKLPVLDAEIVPKIYVDTQINAVKSSDSAKVPLTGTTNTDSTGTVVTTPITGSLTLDVSANLNSMTQMLSFNSVNYADILSTYPIRFFKPDGITYQVLFATNIANPPSGATDPEVVTKGYMYSYVNNVNILSSAVTINTTQSITGLKTFTALTVFENNLTTGAPNFRLTTTTGGIPIDFTVGSDNTLTVTNTKPIVLTTTLLGNSTAPAGSLTTKDYVDNAVSSSVGAVGPYDTVNSKIGLYGSTGKNVAQEGWAILSNLVQYWAQTVSFNYPDSGQRDGGNQYNPEFDISLPTGLFTSLFTIQVTINNAHTSNNDGDDTWIQLISFDPTNVLKYRIKLQGTASQSQGPYSASVFIIGHK